MFNSNAFFSLAGLFGAGIITTLGRTFSVRMTGQGYQEQARSAGKHVIYAFWHEGLLIATYVFRHQNIRVLVSQSRDGEYISRTIHRLGYSTVRGSTPRGGTRALFKMAAAGTAGGDLGITVDGPRGPRHQVQSGILYIAQRSGLPILPFAVACTRKRLLSSWDQFIVPLPFARVAVSFGEPMVVPVDDDSAAIESKRVELEARLLHARDEAKQATRPS